MKYGYYIEYDRDFDFYIVIITQDDELLYHDAVYETRTLAQEHGDRAVTLLNREGYND